MSANAKQLPAILLCLMGLFLHRGIAQQSPLADSPQAAPQPAPLPTIQAEVNVLLLPVVVRDEHGHAVDNLTKEDFKVLDAGKPRAITGFSVERNPALTGDVKATEPAPPTSAPATPVASQRPVSQNRFIVFLFDDRHLSPGDLEQVKQSATKMLDQPFAVTDRAVILSFLGVNSGITRDPAVLKAAVLKLKAQARYQQDTHQCPDIDYYTADQILNQNNKMDYQIALEKTAVCAHYSEKALQDNGSSKVVDTTLQTAARRSLELGNQDALESLSYIRDVIHTMSTLPGQRTLVLISPGFLSLSQDALHLQSQILNTAGTLGVTVNSLDARGLYAGGAGVSQTGGSLYGLQTGQIQQDHGDSIKASKEIMSDLATGTGGTFIHNTNDLEGGLKSTIAAPECRYLLELSLQNVKPNGAYHPLKVDVNQSGLKLQARKGYFAPQAVKNGK